jgi:hypothetical protein
MRRSPQEAAPLQLRLRGKDFREALAQRRPGGAVVPASRIDVAQVVQAQKLGVQLLLDRTDRDTFLIGGAIG